MNSKVNNGGAWGLMEHDFDSYLSTAKSVYVAITINYAGSSLRPSGFIVNCTVSRSSVTESITYRIANPRP